MTNKQAMTLVPFLKGRRLSLRAVEESDAAVFCAAINDESTRQHLGGHQPISITEEIDWIRSRRGKNDQLTLSIVLNKSGACIGNVGLFAIDTTHRSAESGMLIAVAKYRNKGYGPEAKELLLKHAFHTLGLNRIQARVFDINPASRRSLEKSGYRHEGVMRQARFYQGRFIDSHLYSILREEWEARQ